MKAGTCALRIAQGLVAAAAQAGLDPAPLERAIGIANITEPLDARVSIDEMHRVWELIMRTLRDPGFPVHVGTSRTTDDYDVYAFVLMTSATFGEALARTGHYLRVISDGFHWELLSEGRHAHLVLHPHGPLSLGRRCVHECVNVEFVRLCRQVLAPDFRPYEVRFAHAEPADTRAHEAFFGTKPLFEQRRTEVLIDRALLDARLPKADATFLRFFGEELERRLSRLQGPPMATSVRRLLLQGKAETTMDDVARSLGTSRRTLHRRLREEGTTFDELTMDTRQALAIEHVAARKLPLAEVAYVLGFSEPSAFHRAFKRWTGMTPQAYRRAHNP